MDGQEARGTPCLVVVSSGADLGRRIDLRRGEVVIGRAATSDVRFDDPGVSRTHAVLRSRGGEVYVEDTGSTSGTFVNRVRVRGARQLYPGDVIGMASVRLRFEGQSGDADVTRVGSVPIVPAQEPVTPSGGRRDPSAGTRYDVGHQQADMINNVGRDQYLFQQRENFLREVAGTRTRARYLIVLGFLLDVVGFAIFARGVLSFINQIPSTTASDPMPNPFGGKVFGVSAGLIGWSVGAVGGILLMVGIVLHVVATSRRKRADQLYPDPRMSWRQTR